MKTLTKSILILLTTSSLATSAFANSSHDNAYEKLNSAKAGVASLEITLENMGVKVNKNVSLEGLNSYSQKEAAYDAKHAELQAQFDKIHSGL